jgi:FKBP-type peptidyl-prolyl cis-trans isomerase FkpA
MKKNILLLFTAFILIGLQIKAQSNSKVSWKKSSNGLEYAILKHDAAAKKSNKEDFLYLNLSYAVKRNGVDSIIFNSEHSAPGGKMVLQIVESTYKGDIMEGISMLSEKDSALFALRADSFFLKTVRVEQLPPFILPSEKIYFSIGVDEVVTLQEMQAREVAANLQQEENMKTQKAKEISEITEYFKKDGHSPVPSSDGLFLIITEAGEGVPPSNGKTVNVHYTGKLLNGTVFDSSVERGQPFQFKLGQGQVIKGWDLGIALLKPGEKAILGIPSWLAYGARGTGPIPANSPLIFEVQLISYE